MIPLARPLLGEEEIGAVAEVLRSGMLVQGKQVARFEAALGALCGRTRAVASATGTSALHLALRALGVGPGDEVLCPDLTWPSPAHAVRLCGGTVVAVDVHPHEWNATPEAFSEARTPRTRAAIVIDQFGFPARHQEVADALPGLEIIEDAACAIGSTLSGRPAGSFGRIACLSFHPRKVLTTGEGGACVTDDEALADRIRTLRNHGQSAPGRFVEASGNHRMTDLAAAMGLVQLGRLDGAVAARRRLAERYREALPALRVQQPAPGASPNFQTFGAVIPVDGPSRDEAIAALRAAGVEAGALSYALHRLPSVGPQHGHFPHSGELVDRGVALPLYPEMRDEEQDLVIGACRGMLPAGP